MLIQSLMEVLMFGTMCKQEVQLQAWGLIGQLVSMKKVLKLFIAIHMWYPTMWWRHYYYNYSFQLITDAGVEAQPCQSEMHKLSTVVSVWLLGACSVQICVQLYFSSRFCFSAFFMYRCSVLFMAWVNSCVSWNNLLFARFYVCSATCTQFFTIFVSFKYECWCAKQAYQPPNIICSFCIRCEPCLFYEVLCWTSMLAAKLSSLDVILILSICLVVNAFFCASHIIVCWSLCEIKRVVNSC